MGVIDPIRDIPIIRSWHTYVSALQYAKLKGFIMNAINTITIAVDDVLGGMRAKVGDVMIVDVGQQGWQRWMHREGNDPVATAVYHRAVRRGRVVEVDSVAMKIEVEPVAHDPHCSEGRFDGRLYSGFVSAYEAFHSSEVAGDTPDKEDFGHYCPCGEWIWQLPTGSRW